MRHRIMLAALLVVISLLIVGCHTAKETEDVSYITVMGIDKADNDKLKITYRIEIPRAVGTTQGTGQEPKSGPTVINSIIAPNSAEAHNLLSATMSRYANLSHTKAILVSEELARHGVGDILAPLVRYREYRGTMLILVVKGKAENYMLSNQPKIDYLPSKFYESFVAHADESSYFMRTDIHDFYLRLKNPGSSAYASYVAPNPVTGDDKPAKEKLAKNKADAYLAGEIPRTGTENPVEFAGAAIFSGDKMVGTLDTQQVRIQCLLQNNLPAGFWIMSDPLQEQKPINVTLRNGSKPHFDVSLVDGQEIIKIDVFLEGEITGIPSGINYEKNQLLDMLEGEISSLVAIEIQDFIRLTQQLGSDVVGFGRYLRPRLSSYRDLEKLNLEELYRNAAVEIKVATKIRRTGLVWRTAPLKPGANSP